LHRKKQNDREKAQKAEMEDMFKPSLSKKSREIVTNKRKFDSYLGLKPQSAYNKLFADADKFQTKIKKAQKKKKKAEMDGVTFKPQLIKK